MAKVTVSVEVEQSTHQIGVLAAKIVMAIKAKKPALQIAVEELADLEAAVAGLSQVPVEEKEDLGAFIRALVLPMADIAGALLAPPAPAPVAAPAAPVA